MKGPKSVRSFVGSLNGKLTIQGPVCFRPNANIPDMFDAIVPREASFYKISGGPNEEGWSRSEECVGWDANEEAFTRWWRSEGQDCDGRYESGGEQIYKRVGNKWTWADKDKWQRDHAAEAMGY